MVNNGFNNGRYYEDVHSAGYDRISGEYADMWRGHDASRVHHEAVRGKFLEWRDNLSSASNGHAATPESGTLVICGPGFQVDDYRDLSPDIVSGVLPRYPLIVGADWSPAVLANFEQSLTKHSPGLGSKIELARRDFSGGLSGKFHDLISSRLEQVRTYEDFQTFMSWISGEVGLEEVRRHVTADEINERDYQHEIVNPRIKHVLDVTEPLDFSSVTQGRAEVRFLTANMLLAGMFALTEKDVRDAILLHAKGDEEKGRDLEAWHRLIEELNTEVASRFMIRGLELNPHMHIFAPTDSTTHYEGLDTFSRLNLQALKERVRAKGFKFVNKGHWTQDDRTEFPPHDHDIQMLLACANGNAHEIPVLRSPVSSTLANAEQSGGGKREMQSSSEVSGVPGKKST